MEVQTKDFFESAHYMFDIETLSNTQNSIILSLAVVKFDLKSGEIFSKFITGIDPDEQSGMGIGFNWNTMLWWINNTEKAKKVLTTTKFEPVVDALYNLDNFLSFSSESDVIYVWGKGPSFDQGIISNLYEKIGRKIPWEYYNERCVRTVYDFMTKKEIEKANAEIPDFVAHDPISDAILQAKVVSKFYSKF